MSECFFESLDPATIVLVCKHVLEKPEEMELVYYSEDGQTSCVCERDHDMESGLDFRWAHAEHICELFPQTQKLLKHKPGHVAKYFPSHGEIWVVESLLDDA